MSSAIPRQLLHDVTHERLGVAEEHEVVVEVVERVSMPAKPGAMLRLMTMTVCGLSGIRLRTTAQLRSRPQLAQLRRYEAGSAEHGLFC